MDLHRHTLPGCVQRSLIDCELPWQLEQREKILFDQGLHRERFAAAAGRLFVGIAELEPLVQALTRVVQLSAINVGQAFGVNKHLDAMALEHLVLGDRIIHVLELVSHARTACGPDSKTQANAPAPLLKVFADVVSRLSSQSDSHLITPNVFACSPGRQP